MSEPKRFRVTFEGYVQGDPERDALQAWAFAVLDQLGDLDGVTDADLTASLDVPEDAAQA